jgi:polyhydroxyalkanoate synthase
MENLINAGEIDTGVTPKDAVYTDDKLVLYRYQRPADVAQQKIPLLVVYALVNRPYMTDIQENRSTIKGLLATGQDVYLIDWGYPDQADRSLTLDDYINGYIDRCVDHIRETHGLDKINILGICQGGSFSLMYSALHPEKVQNLVTMVTPVDFKTPDNLLSAWVQNIDVDLAVDTMGNIPGELLNWTFLSLKPFSLTGQKYVNMVDMLDDPAKVKNFLRMEKWIFDSPDQAGETFREFIKGFYQQNGFIEGTATVGGETGRPASRSPARCSTSMPAGPPGAAGCLEGAERPHRQRGLHRARLPRRPHRHLRQRQGAEGGHARHRQLAERAPPGAPSGAPVLPSAGPCLQGSESEAAIGSAGRSVDLQVDTPTPRLQPAPLARPVVLQQRHAVGPTCRPLPPGCGLPGVQSWPWFAAAA